MGMASHLFEKMSFFFSISRVPSPSGSSSVAAFLHHRRECPQIEGDAERCEPKLCFQRSFDVPFPILVVNVRNNPWRHIGTRGNGARPAMAEAGMDQSIPAHEHMKVLVPGEADEFG